MDLIIKNGRIFNSDTDCIADIAISHGKIVAIGKGLHLEATRKIEARNRIIVPGGVDVHTHLNMPFMGAFSADDFESGTIAAAFGGTTSIVDFAMQKDKCLLDTLDEWKERAINKASVDYAFHIVITNPDKTNIDQIDQLRKQGVTSIKLFMAYKNELMLDDDQILRVFRACKKNGILPVIHAENGNIIAEQTRELLKKGLKSPKYHAESRHELFEIEAIQRIIKMACYVDLPIYIAHVSTIQGAMEILRARMDGRKVFYETCPHYLLFNETKYSDHFESAKYVMSPPLRREYNRSGLRNLLKKGLIDVVSTDHCPFHFKSQKIIGKNDFSKIPNGVGGIENRMQIIYNEMVNKLRASIHSFVKCTSSNPAKLFGLYPRKGAIQISSDADLVILNPRKPYTVSSKSNHENADYSIYEGYRGMGKIETVVINGKIKINDGLMVYQDKEGEFIRRNRSMAI